MPLRAAKRAKLSVPSSSEENIQNGDNKHTMFTEWAQNRGVDINGIKPAKLPGRGLGLLTTRAIKSAERILFVPEKAMFKPNARFLKSRSLERVSPQAQLAISAMAVCKAEQSPLAVWQATWPTADDFWQSMPLCWTQAEREMLPPSVLQPLERQLEDYKKDWSAVTKACKDSAWSEEDFKYYWMIINSRSFHWKPPRGRPGSMVMCPFIDYMNHGPTGTTCNVFQTPQGYEVLADRDYEAGEEVLATYGSHSNDKLLVHYGFVITLPPSKTNLDDDVRLDHLLLPKLSDSVKSQLQDVGFLGAYALLPSSNELCFKTQVAVRAVLLTCNEWEYFVTNGEDLTSDQTEAVDDFMRPLLRQYRTACCGKVESILAKAAGEDLDPIMDLAVTRWSQIWDALEAYIDRH